MFKISGGGRLQFIIYRDQPTSPANEIKEIPIEEFGGLESSLKLDNEKFVFYVITTSVTDCFSADSAEELNEWTTLLQEYLGKGEREGERWREGGWEEEGGRGEEGGRVGGGGRERGGGREEGERREGERREGIHMENVICKEGRRGEEGGREGEGRRERGRREKEGGKERGGGREEGGREGERREDERRREGIHMENVMCKVYWE